jgi:hypothetical protein
MSGDVAATLSITEASLGHHTMNEPHDRPKEVLEELRGRHRWERAKQHRRTKVAWLRDLEQAVEAFKEVLPWTRGRLFQSVAPDVLADAFFKLLSECRQLEAVERVQRLLDGEPSVEPANPVAEGLYKLAAEGDRNGLLERLRHLEDRDSDFQQEVWELVKAKTTLIIDPSREFSPREKRAGHGPRARRNVVGDDRHEQPTVNEMSVPGNQAGESKKEPPSNSQHSEERDVLDRIEIEILQSLELLGALTEDDRKSASLIAKKIGGMRDAAALKRPLKRLNKLKLVDAVSNRGPNGGYWITPTGRRRLERNNFDAPTRT